MVLLDRPKGYSNKMTYIACMFLYFCIMWSNNIVFRFHVKFCNFDFSVKSFTHSQVILVFYISSPHKQTLWKSAKSFCEVNKMWILHTFSTQRLPTKVSVKCGHLDSGWLSFQWQKHVKEPVPFQWANITQFKKLKLSNMLEN